MIGKCITCLAICLSVYALILDRIRSFRNVGGKFSILARKESRIWLGFFSTHLGLESKNEVDDILLFGMSQLPVYVCVRVCCVYQSANPRTKFRPQPCKAAERQARGISSIVPTILVSALKTSFSAVNKFPRRHGIGEYHGGLSTGQQTELTEFHVFHDGPILSPCSPGWGLGMYKMLFF